MKLNKSTEPTAGYVTQQLPQPHQTLVSVKKQLMQDITN